MIKLRGFLIGMMCLVGMTSYAQQITGYVTDAETGDSIPYASVV